MRVEKMTLHAVRLKLKKMIRHASYQRQESENLFVCCRLNDGTTGWGEGVPRTYVTGESVDGAFSQWTATDLEPQFERDCSGWPDVVSICENLKLAQTVDDPRGSYGNTLRCAIELSILDAFGKVMNQPVSAVLKHIPVNAADLVETPRPRVQYSGAITSQKPRQELLSALKMRCYGFSQCKVKVGQPNTDERQRLARLGRILGARMDIRVDANEAWSPDEVKCKAERLANLRISCLEQPVPHEEVRVCADLRTQVAMDIMLDESITCVHDAEVAIRDETCDLFNIRLSKCGGIIRSLQLADIARSAGIGYQLGCHPGESPLLSAAGRHWASCVTDIRYLEGSYDRHVLYDWPTVQDVTFGYGGWAPAIQQPGLGVTIDPHKIEQMATRQHA